MPKTRTLTAITAGFRWKEKPELPRQSGYYDRFEVPLADPTGEVRFPAAQTRRRRLFRPKPRRLAVLDTHLPWRLSGFRYYEFDEIARQRPDTLFFSLHEMAEAFASPVHPLADFPIIAANEGVTDVYMVFLNFGASVLGLANAPGATTCPGVDPRLSLARTLRALRIRTHLTLYPGGGITMGTSPDFLTYVATQCATTFTNVSWIHAAIPGSVFSHAVTSTTTYTPPDPRTRDADAPLQVCFAADDRPRKGLEVVIKAFESLDPARFHLHLVGPHAKHQERFESGNVTVYGWLAPEALARIYRQSDVFVSPVSVDTDSDDGEVDMVDGFPTGCAVDAMASGCCLVTSNPTGASPILEPGWDFLEIPVGSSSALAETLRQLASERGVTAEVARRGCESVHARMAVDVGVREKLARMLG